MTTLTADLDQARRWLTTLHGGAPGLINIVATGEWAGRTFTTDDAGINAAVGYIHTLDRQNKEGIYIRVTTLRQAPPPGKRGGAKDSLAFPGFWADIDIAGPGHKTKAPLPATVQDAQRIIAVSGLPEPTMWIHSGGGLYPWHLLDEPALVTADNYDDMATLAARWQLVILAASEQLGYHYGSGVGDLARVLRIPGTINRKAGLTRPCTVLEASGITYSLEDLATALYSIDLPDPEPAASPTPPPRTPTTVTRTGTAGPFDALAEICEWRDLFEPYGLAYVGSERDGAQLWVRPGASSKYSIRAWPHVCVNHSENLDLPVGGGSKLTHGKVFAYWHHGGDAHAAGRDLIAAAAGNPAASPAARVLPARVLDHIQRRCAVRPWTPGAPPATPAGSHPALIAPSSADAEQDVRHIMAAAEEDTIWAGVFASTGHLRGATWTTPGSDERPALLPPFPLHTLPGDTGKFVEAVATYTQTPPEIAAFATIGALATVVGSHATITGQWTEETLALFLASIADSGDGKSRAFKAVNAPIYRLESNLRHTWDATYGDNAERLEIAQATRDKIIKDLASANGDKRTALLADLDAVKDTIAELTGPPRPQLLVGDVLPEALALLMYRVGGHISIVSAEGTFLGNICGRYNNGKPNLEFVLVSWDASEPWRPDRISRDSFELERPSLTLSLSVQPVVIDDAVASKAVTDKGLLNRFLLTRPASLAGSRDMRPPQIPAHLAEAWDTCVRRAFYSVRPEGKTFDDDGTPLPPVPMQVAEDAEQLMLAWREHHERRLDPDTGDLVCIKGWMSRAPGSAYRLAALLHLAAGHGPRQPVNAAVMADALTVIDYCVPHAMAILGGEGDSSGGQVGWVKDACEHVMAWIRRKGMAEFTADQARGGLRGRSWVKEHGAPGVRAVLLALATEGWIASVSRADAAGRRLSDPLFVPHPELLGRSA